MKIQTSAVGFLPRLAFAGLETGSRFNRIRFGLLAGLGFAATSLFSAAAQAATAPDLASTSPYGIVSSTFTNTSAGTTIDGDVCYTTPPAVVPFISGATVVPCPPVTGTDQNAARADLVSQECAPIGAAVALNEIMIGGGPPGVFPPGCYSSTGAMSITASTTVTLSGTGVYIFRPGGEITAGANSNIVVESGACENEVFWAPVGATTIGANANFVGNIFRGTADGLSITFGDSSSLIGRALAFGSTVTTDDTSITVPEECPEPNTVTVQKNFIPDSTETVEINLNCTSGTVTTTPLDAAEGVPAVFTVTGAAQGVTCTATETTVPAGHTANQSDCVDVPLGGTCEITNVQDELPNRATFRVEKDFTDGNPMDVEVTISCNSGLPIEQSMEIDENNDVEFVVTAFDPGELDCDVTETLAPGYIPAYTATATTGEGVISYDEEGCHFDDVIFGQFVCSIFNSPGLVDIEIEKLWVFDGTGDEGVDTRYSLRLYCDAPIGLVEIFEGEGSDKFLAQVQPQYPSTGCWVDETVSSSGVEVDNGCTNLVVSAAQGGASCRITNTVFFEGIPTLGQYGVAVLALLLLGVGLAGFRRFA